MFFNPASLMDKTIVFVDINECDGNPCQAGMKCINTLGSHLCSQCLNGTNYVNGKCEGNN